MTPRPWRYCAVALIVLGVAGMLFGTLLFCARPRGTIQHLAKHYVEPTGIGHDSYRRVWGQSLSDFRPVQGPLLMIAGAIPFGIGLSVLHRESLHNRPR